jgi:hypothetical protein
VAKALRQSRLGNGALEKFERAATFKPAIAAGSEPDLAHAAPSEEAFNDVCTGLFASQGSGEQGAETGTFGWGAVEKTTVRQAIVLGEQLVQPLREGRLRALELGEPGLSFGRGQVETLVQGVADPLPGWGDRRRRIHEWSCGEYFSPQHSNKARDRTPLCNEVTVARKRKIKYG